MCQQLSETKVDKVGYLARYLSRISPIGVYFERTLRIGVRLMSHDRCHQFV